MMRYFATTQIMASITTSTTTMLFTVDRTNNQMESYSSHDLMATDFTDAFKTLLYDWNIGGN